MFCVAISRTPPGFFHFRQGEVSRVGLGVKDLPRQRTEPLIEPFGRGAEGVEGCHLERLVA